MCGSKSSSLTTRGLSNARLNYICSTICIKYFRYALYTYGIYVRVCVCTTSNLQTIHYKIQIHKRRLVHPMT